MTKKEKEDWGKLYEYVKKDILKYKKEMRVPIYFIRRLKGLSEGKFMANKHVPSLGEYTFEQILLTFKISKVQLENALFNRSRFKNEQHLVNTIMLIVEKNINDVVNRMDLAKQTEKKNTNIQDKISKPSDKKYVKKTTDKSKVKKILKDIL